MTKYIGRDEVIRICSRLCEKNVGNYDMAFALNWVIESVNRIPAADVVPRSETCPYFVHNENDRGNDSLCGKAGCEVEAVQPVVRCGVCELHGHCYTEDVFAFSRLAEENRFCAVGKAKTNCGFCGADMRGDEDVRYSN